ncbi:methyltransferase domain-containing protein [bacterium]|nr:methyltransferase domain-containing protein [bacterium]
MNTLEKSVVTAMDGSEIELFPYLPYILQDVWEIGASPEIIIDLVRKHAKEYPALKVLDLGCGKGAVSIKLAAKLKCHCYGIDAIKEFIEEAGHKAKEFGVDSLCKFEVNDIRIKTRELFNFDIVILGAIGPVFGNYFSTLSILSKVLKQNGLIIIDDGHIENGSDFIHPLMQKKEVILKQISDAGMDLIDEVIIKNDEIKDLDDYILENLKKRCNELKEKYPEKISLFENYIKKQEEENDILETKVVCSTMVIRNK